jgi:SET domain-containing protein
MPRSAKANSKTPSALHSPRLLVRSSSIHAAGCYTLDPIARGSRIAEYDGVHVTKAVADERYADRPVTYLFACGSKGDVIDGFGTPMFINHSCAPNCETEDRNGRVFIRALRDIAAQEELLYEYNLYDSDDPTADCYCGAPQCRGTMFSEDEVKRQERRKARKAAKK